MFLKMLTIDRESETGNIKYRLKNTISVSLGGETIPAAKMPMVVAPPKSHHRKPEACPDLCRMHQSTTVMVCEFVDGLQMRGVDICVDYDALHRDTLGFLERSTR